MTPELNPLANPICLSSPHRLTPASAWHEHIPFLMYLVCVLRPAVVVEVGTEEGDSYCAFCQAVKELRLDTRCYAVATGAGDTSTGSRGSAALRELRIYHDPLYGSFSALLESDPDDGSSHFEDGTIDLLTLGVNHGYDIARRNVERWLPKLSPAGVLLLHGINAREGDAGSWKLWHEVKSKYSHFQFPNGRGIGVLGVGADYPKSLHDIFMLSAGDAAVFRQFFYELGYGLVLRAGAASLQEQITQLRGHLERLCEEESRLQAIVESQQQAVLRGHQEIGRLRGEQHRLHAELEREHADLEAHRRKLEAVESSLSWRVITRYSGFRDRLLPHGSRRRAFYDTALRRFKS